MKPEGWDENMQKHIDTFTSGLLATIDDPASVQGQRNAGLTREEALQLIAEMRKMFELPPLSVTDVNPVVVTKETPHDG